MTIKHSTEQAQPYRFEVFEPYTTFTSDGKPALIPYTIDGLLPQGGMSVLGAKPKQGKSSLSREEAAAVVQGRYFLDRKTTQGDVLLVSLEDPRAHVDNHLKALNYNPVSDGQIHIVTSVSHDLEKTLDALRDFLSHHPDIHLVVIDHIASLLRVKDVAEYMPMLVGMEGIRAVARDFPRVHIQTLCHSKKVQTDDPFDQLLGSTALRGVPDTNIALFGADGQRVIATETRIGRPFVPSILHARIVEIAGAVYPADYSLGDALADREADRSDRKQRKQELTYDEKVLAYLENSDNYTATQQALLESVTGRDESLIYSIKKLEEQGIVTCGGSPRSLQLALTGDALKLYRLALPPDSRAT